MLAESDCRFKAEDANDIATMHKSQFAQNFVEELVYSHSPALPVDHSSSSIYCEKLLDSHTLD